MYHLSTHCAHRYEQLVAKATADRELWEQQAAMKQQHQEKEKEQLVQHYLEKLAEEEERRKELIRQRSEVMIEPVPSLQDH